MSDPKRILRNSLVVFSEVEKLSGENLPSCREVLEVYFYRRKQQKKSPRESARIAIRQCMQFWEHAELKTQQEITSIMKLERLLGDYSKLIKSVNRKNDHTIAMRRDFETRIENLFDIAHQDVMNEATPRAQEFLMNQRIPRRRDTLGQNFTAQMEISQMVENQITENDSVQNYANCSWIDDVDIRELLEENDDSGDEDFSISINSSAPKRMKTLDFDTSAALDRGAVSNRNAARILAAFMKNVGYSLNEVSLSRETLRRERRKYRLSAAQLMKENFSIKSDDRLFVHWDGKQLPESNSLSEYVDRLPILISGDAEKLLAIPKIDRGTGEDQARAVFEALKNWCVEKNVCGMVFDTTSSNTGANKGACIIIERLLGRSLLHCACRHHIFELSLKTAYESCLGGTSGPEVLLFKRFQKEWKNIDKNEYSPGIQDAYIDSGLKNQREEILNFVLNQLQKKIARNDYRELLELICTFLDESTKKFPFRALGPIHHARWMSKAVYALKIFLFRNQFKLSCNEIRGLRDFCIFIISIYTKSWFTATDAKSAPRNDLSFLVNLFKYRTTNSKVVDAVYKQIEEKHLWYLGEELIGLSFFDDEVSFEIKKKMSEAIIRRPGNEKYIHNKRLSLIERDQLFDITLDQFVTVNTIRFFEKLRLSTTFLKFNPEEWESCSDYQENKRILSSFQVVNDRAERSVALIKEYNRLLTKDENDLQALMQVVSKYREKVKDCNKETLEVGLSKFIFSEKQIDYL